MGIEAEAGSEKSALELLQEFKATGCQQSFEEIVRRYAGMVFHVCLKVTKNAHDAEDATQAVFLTLAVQAKTAREIRYIGPWLQQVARRVALDMRKSKNRRELREEQHGALAQARSDPATNGNGEHAFNVQEMNGLVGEELNKLPPKYRLPLILHYYGGLSREAMAKELNCKPATLGVRLHRGREMLGTRLAQRGIVLAEGAMAMSLVCYIHSSVTDSLVASTCQAASSLFAGRDLQAGLVSAQVVGIAKNAVRAVLVAKLKLAAAVALAAGTALAAGAEVVGKIHPLDLNWNLDLGRLIRPMLAPLFRPTLSQAAPQAQPLPELPNLRPADGSPYLPTQSGVAWTPWSSGAVEGTPPVYIPPTAQPRLDRPTPGAGRATTAQLQSLLETQRTVALSNPAPINRSVVTAAMVLGGQPAPLPLKSSVPERVNNGFSIAAAPAASVRGGDMPVQADASPAPFHASSLSSSNRIPMAGNVPIGPFAAGENIVLPPPPQPGADGPADRTTRVSKTGGTGASSSHATMYLNPAPVPIPSGPVALNHVMLDGTAPMDARAVQTYATATTDSYAVATRTATTSAPELRMLPQISGTTLLATSDTLEGWGTVGPADAFDQNGRVIADGQGAPQTLDLSQVGMVLNTVDNSTSRGPNGWFALRGGKLLLPPLAVHPGSGSYTWGEDAADPTLDLVNSLRLAVLDAGKPARLSVALLSPDRTDYPPVPTSEHVIDVWEFDSTEQALGAMTLALRYDDAAVTYQSLSETALTLWRFDHGWDKIRDSFVLDTTQKTIEARVDSLSYLALAAPEIGSIEKPEGLSNDSAGLLSAPFSFTLALNSTVVTPEPGGMLLIAAAALLLARRRRR